MRRFLLSPAMPSTSAGRAGSCRRGITLLEVLISIFVAAVGLLGLAALIPVGRFNVLEASKNDRASAVGRAAYREIKARGMLRYDMWMNTITTDDPTPSPPTITGALQNWFDPNKNSVPVLTPVEFGNSVCLDPLWIGRQMSGSGVPTGGNLFPMPWTDSTDADPPGAPYMTRTTIRAWAPNGTYAPILGFSTGLTTAIYPAAERICRSNDDLLFQPDSDETKRPTPVWGSDTRMQSAGDYSWIATVSPGDWVGLGAPKTYLVSVAVFYKRNLVPLTGSRPFVDSPPSERFVYADFLSGGVGVGGGDVRLRLVDTSGFASPNESDFPPIKPNTWLMLAGWISDTSQNMVLVNGSRGSPNIQTRPIFQWYRILSVSSRTDGQAGPELFDNSTTALATPSGKNEWVYDVTLAGPDFDPSKLTGDADSVGLITAYAAVFENVVGVYTKTIEADSWAMP